MAQHSHPRISLVTRGDDGGANDAANHAVATGLMRGVLRNASIMVPGRGFPRLAEMLRGVRGVDLGLHVVLNSEWEPPFDRWGPILPPEKVPSLVEADGTFTRMPQVLHERQASADEMIAEVQAQLETARKAGLEVGYIDEHMGVGWVCGLKARLQDLARREGLVYADGLPGLPGGESTDDAAADLEKGLLAAPAGTYVMVNHPYSLSHAQLNDMPPGHAEQRDRDRQFWLDPRIRDALARAHCEPVRYTQVLKAG
jgi:hypothetical protein